ncbi:MAG: M20/M25/M40 family metallo-hydrolase [Gemmatimonadales bacterium]
MRRLPLFGLLLASNTLTAQTSSPLAHAAASITPADVARRIGIIADDSMMGRDTPSRGLELTAQYVADQFRSFGLKPGGENGTWFQRYPITHRRLDLAASHVIFEAAGVSDTATFTRAARSVSSAIATRPTPGTAVLVGGALSVAALSHFALEDRLVLYPLDFSKPISDNRTKLIRAMRLAGARAVVLLSNLDSAAFAAKLPRRAPERSGAEVERPVPPVVEVADWAVARALRAAHVDLAAVRGSSRPFYRAVPSLTVRVAMADSVLSSSTAPNTVGILEGSDPKLNEEYVVFSAHMDHIGITPGPTDSINNGADDDGSGTAGVMELAEAFSRPGVRPRRSIIFLTVSGEEKGLWGSRYFSEHPAVPLPQIVADLNIDMIGRNWPDTIVAIGKDQSDLGRTLERVNAAHRELGMTAIDDRWPDERFYFRSDHYNFARKGVPILFFFNGVHPDYHQVTDSPDKINSEKESRILKLLFYLGQDVANAPKRPAWNPESYKEIVEDETGR